MVLFLFVVQNYRIYFVSVQKSLAKFFQQEINLLFSNAIPTVCDFIKAAYVFIAALLLS